MLLKGHHEGYIDWATYERNQAQLAANAYRKAGGAKSGRGGRALLAGLLTCGLLRPPAGRSPTRAGAPGQPVYRCDRPNQMLGLPRCLSVRRGSRRRRGRRRAAARLGAGGDRGGAGSGAGAGGRSDRTPPHRRAGAAAGALRGDPRGAALRGLRSRQPPHRRPAGEELGDGAPPRGGVRGPPGGRGGDAGPDRGTRPTSPASPATWRPLGARPARPCAPASGCVRAWSRTSSPTSTRPRARSCSMIHWKGGQHSELRVKKPRTGEHGCRTPEEALAVMRRMAASLERRAHRRVAEPDGDAHRPGEDPGRRGASAALRTVHGMRAYRSAEKDGEWLTLSEAAAALGRQPATPSAV